MSKFKLSRSKREDSKQPKISNFFGLAKQECKSLASKEPRNNEIYSDTNLQLTSKEPSTQADRLPGDTICMKCFSKLNNDSCNNCNVSHSASKEINLPSGTIEDSAQITSCDKIEGKNDMSTDLITDLINEDVIPATPQLHKKRKRTDYVSAKSIKKIVNAENKKTEISKTKTKNVLVQKEDSHKALGEENPKLMCNEKENALSSRGMHNPFAKSSNKLPTFRQINEQHGIQNEECTVRITDSNKPHNTDTVGQTGSFVNGFHDNVFFNNKRLPQDNLVFSFEDINDSFLEDWNLSENSSHAHVNLDNGVRCEVVSTSVHADSGEMLLTLRPFSASVRATAICVLRGSWANTSVSAGDTVSVSAVPVPDQPGCWVVDDTVGLLTIHPDTLVSGTTVVGSLFCMRRSVLSDSYRGLDSDSSIMVIGSFLHELLQEVLKKKVFSIQDMKKVLDEFISSRHFIYSLYASGMPFEKTKETLSEFIPKIHAFVMKYIGSRKLNVGNTWNDKESWDGKVTDVADIEENIWAPKLGVKGKVDVTVHTVSRNKKKVMPLELKTGRASFSAEHRGQVILYTMMMSELGQSVDSGLLLYLREGIMREVSVGPVERRDLTLLRNQLVSWLRESQRVVMEGSRVVTPNLPPPISHHSACGKCPYLTLCSAALRVGDRNSMSEDNPLQGLSVASTDHLTLEHMEYVFHWSGLLRLEHAEALLRGTPVHNIWTVPPAQRKQKGSCLVNLTLVGQVTEVTAGSYEHVFELGGCGWEGAGPTEGDYYIVSCNERPAVAAGPVRHVLNNHIILHLERDLCAHYGKDRQWHLDKYESQTSLVFNMTNLGCLLDNTQQAGRLRSALVDLQLPTFQPKLRSRVMRESAGLINRLNSQQQQAVIRAIAADHFMLIKGMPGTGKTATMVALVELAVRLGQSVLITSHTHSAVDNVLLRLRGRVDLLRLGSTHKLHPQLAEYGEHTGQFTTPDEIQAFYNSKSVVGVTCLGAAHPLLVRRRFDMCLVDEATQVPQPTVLRPLMAANKFILVGDPEQLPPMVRSSQAKKLGLGQSLFARLDRPAVTTELSLQYRMNKRITQLANTLTYGGQLQCASPAVAEATLKLLHPLVGVPEWLSRALADSLAHSVVVLDTGTREESVNCENHYEGGIVSDIVTALNKAGVSAERTGVIAPYRAQVELLRKRVRAIDSQVEVNTVDQYQGRDKDVIIYSCTRSSIATERDILSDKNRLTVAITRSRYKLIIVGNVTLLRGYPLFDKLFRSLIDDCIIPIR